MQGLQGQPNASNPFVKVIATCKHFAAYSLEEVAGESRFWFDAKVGAQDLTDTFLPAFEACAKAGARAVMCSCVGGL